MTFYDPMALYGCNVSLEEEIQVGLFLTSCYMKENLRTNITLGLVTRK